MEVKRNFKIVPTEFKQIFEEIYEKDKIADQPTEKLQDEELLDVSEKEIEQLQEASLNLTNSSGDTEKEEKCRGPLNVGVQSFSEQNDYSLEDAVLNNLKLTFQENVLHSSSNLSSESSNLYHKKGNKSEIECTCNLNEEYVAYDAEIIKISNSQIAINEMKEDEAFGMKLAGNLNRNTKTLESDSGCLLQSSSLASHFDVWCTRSDDMQSIYAIQEKKPTLTTATKLNEKTKRKENLFHERDHNDNNSPNEEKVTSERVNIPEQTAPGKQVKPLHFPLSYLERKSQGLESNKESNSDSVHLDVESKRAERCEKVRVKEKTMEVKRNFKTVPTEFKQIFGEIYDKDKIADQPTEKLQDEELLDVSEEEIEQLQEASLNLTNSSSDTEKEEKGRGPLSVGVQSFSEQNDYSLQDAVLKLTFPEQVLQSPSNLSSESRNLHHKKGDKSEIECTCDLNEEYVAYDAENIILAGTQTAVNERKEDEAFGRKLAGNLNRNTTTLESDSERLLQSSSVASHCDVWCTSSDDMRSIIQEEKPAFKFNEKTKVKENFLQKRDHNDNNSPNEVRP
ncbi:uncharacterized protein LOC110204006 isoform X1 [Phascolarctos cinereus]